MTQYAYKDNAVGRLASPLDSADLTAVLEAGQGANFPTLSVAVPAILTVVQYSVPTDPSSTVVFYEKIKVTVKSTDTLTITERGVGDTSAHDFNAGDYVYLNLTEDFVTGLYDEINTKTVSTATTNALVENSRFNLNSTGTVAVGFGAKHLQYLENASGTLKLAGLHGWVWTDPVNGSEDADYVIYTGSAETLTEKFRIKSNGSFGFGTSITAGVYTFVQGNLAYDNGAGFRIQSSASADRNFIFFFTDETNGYSGIQSYRDGTGTGAKTLHLNKLGGKVVAGGGFEVVGDAGGTASSLGLSNVFNTSISTGTGTVKLAGATARNSVGWAKFYNGTTPIYIPYWTTITG